MRPLLAATTLLLAATPALAQDWTTIPLGTTSNVNAIEKTSFSQVIVVGDAGFAAQSTDGTQTAWTPLAVNTSADLLAVHQPSWTEIWISGDGGTVKRLIAGTFQNRGIGSGEDFVIFSRSSGWSFAGGTGGSMYRTTDAGNTWNFQYAAGAAIHDGNGFVGSLAIAVGDNGTILKTTNGGVAWTPIASGTSANLYAYKDVAGGILVGGEGGTMLKSTDSGDTWVSISLPTSETIWDIDSSGQNGNWVLASGSNGTLLRSTNAGTTWCNINTQTTADLFAVDMTLNATWTIAGEGGLMKRTTNSGGGCFSPTDAPVVGPAGSFRLGGPWPQPIARDGRFSLQVDRGQTVRADVVDVAGRHVASVMDGRMVPGETRQLAFDARNVNAGVYFMRVQGEDFSETRKMVVVR